MMKRVIITGANGFIGRNTIKYFIENDVEVIGIVRPNDQTRPIKHSLIKYYPLDLAQSAALIKELPHTGFDAFIHLAWEGSAGNLRFDYSLQMKNALYTVEALKVAQVLGCDRFVCAGSITEKETLLSLETNGGISFPISMYGLGKLVAHTICKSVAAEIGIDLIWMILTNVFGENDSSQRFINTTINKFIHNEPLRFSAGTQYYDFIYISDAVRAIFLTAQKGKPFGEYLIGSSNAMPLKEFIFQIKKELDSDAPLLFDAFSSVNISLPLGVFSTGETEAHTGFKAETPFNDGIRKTYEWLRNV